MPRPWLFHIWPGTVYISATVTVWQAKGMPEHVLKTISASKSNVS
jgi:hypothetical protein